MPRFFAIFAVLFIVAQSAYAAGYNYNCSVEIVNGAVITNRNGKNPSGTTANFSWNTQNDKFRGVYFKTYNPSTNTYGAVHAAGCESRGPQAPNGFPNVISCTIMTYSSFTTTYGVPGVPVYGNPTISVASAYEGYPTIGFNMSGVLSDGYGVYIRLNCNLDS